MPDAETLEAAVLVSGGIDSSILACRMARRLDRVHPLYVRSGLRWEAAEEAGLREFLRRVDEPTLAPLAVLELPVSDLYAGHWSLGEGPVPGEDSPDEAVYLPGRNLLLASKAALWCQARGIETLALGHLASNPFADGSPAFFRLLEATIREGSRGRFDLIRPFERMTKAEVMRLGSALPLESTFSCLDPVDGRHCGACNKCGERRRAFRSVDRPDLTAYAAPSKEVRCIE